MRADRVEHTVAYMFSGYREVHEELQALGIEAQSPFPPTFQKSALGMELSEKDLQTR